MVILARRECELRCDHLPLCNFPPSSRGHAMSVSYIIIPLDSQTLEWAMDSGVPAQGLLADGRQPTFEELWDVCGAIPKCSVRLDQRKESYDICIESQEKVTFSYAGDISFQNTISLGIAVSPARSGSISRVMHSNGQSQFLSYHGDIDLLIAIIRKLTVTCGTQVFIVDCEGLPWIINSPTASPIGPEPWAGSFPTIG